MNRRSGERGFTLLEMLVTLAVLALATGVAFPAVERALARQEFALAAARIELAARDARADAIRTDARVDLTANPVPLPKNVRIELPRGGVSFFADGSASGGSVALIGARQSHRFAIDADSGAVVSERR